MTSEAYGHDSAPAVADEPTRFDELRELRRRATTSYWGSHAEALPYLETFFGAEPHLNVPVPMMKDLVPAATIPIRDGFPVYAVPTAVVATTMPWGWLGMIPFDDTQTPPKVQPTYLWLLGRSGAFVYREKFWEDTTDEFANAIGIYHLLSKLVLSLRFLDRVARRLDVSENTRFRVGVALNNVRGRSLTNEKTGVPDDRRTSTTERQVEASLDVTLGAFRAAREDVVLNLVEEITWQFRRQDWSRQDLVTLLRSAAQ